jgi:hypothetical protein
MNETQKNELLEKIEVLKASLVGEMFADMEAKDQIHNLQMELKGVKPEGSEFDCMGCGS